MADSETHAQPETRHGIGVSPGTAYGPVVQVAPPVRPPANEGAVDDEEAALADVRAAFESVAVSAGARSSATMTLGSENEGTPGAGTPSTAATARDPTSRRSATRSAK